jgi:hypothetical protein
MGMSVDCKKKEDVEKALGKSLANNLLKAARKGFMKRVPFSITFTDSKPQFYLDNGDMLKAYAFDMQGNLLGEAYCGSGDTVLHHAGVQLGEGQKAPQGVIVAFVNTYASSSNHPWSLTIVTNELIKQIA